MENAVGRRSKSQDPKQVLLWRPGSLNRTILELFERLGREPALKQLQECPGTFPRDFQL